LPRLSHPSFIHLLLGVALIAGAYFAITTARYVARNYQLRSEEQGIRREIRELEAERVQLIAVRDYLQSDEYLEYMARRVLGLVRPGETLVVVSGNEAAAEPTAVRTPGDDWWKALFGAAPAAAATPVVPAADP
jgi:cell division protein FtsB